MAWETYSKLIVNEGLRRGASLGFYLGRMVWPDWVWIAGSISTIKNRNELAGSLHRLHAPYDVSFKASSLYEKRAIKTSWQGVGDHDQTGQGEKLWTGRDVEPPFKLLFETHAFMEKTDTDRQTRNNVGRSLLAPIGPRLDNKCYWWSQMPQLEIWSHNAHQPCSTIGAG